jgi:hypothetical protein
LRHVNIYIKWDTFFPILHTSLLVYAFNIPYIYEYITKLCRKQAKFIQNHGNANVCNIGQGEPRHRKFKRLKLGDGQVYHRSSV